MKMKKILAMLLCVAMMCALFAACSSNKSAETSEPDASSEEKQTTEEASEPETEEAEEAAPAEEAEEEPEADSAADDAFKDGPTYNLKLGHVQTSTHSYHIGAAWFADEIEKRSNGKITVEVHPSSQLGNERDLAESVQMGTVDMAIVGVGVLANFDPSFEIFNLPFLFNDREHAYKVLGGEFGKEKFEKLEDYDIVGLGYYENGFFDILANKETELPEDTTGLNIRTMENQVYMSIFEEIGANPVPMAFGEVYTALQNGTVDGVCTSVTALVPNNFQDVAKYFEILDMCFTPTPFIMSKEVLSGMPQEYQDLIREVAEESVQVQWDETVRQEEEGIAAMEAAGCTVQKVTDRQAWIDAIVEPVYASVADIIPQEEIDAVRNAA